MYEVKSVNGQNLLKKLNTSPLQETKFYQDKNKVGSFMVSCKRFNKGTCVRSVTGSLIHNDEAYEIRPAEDTLSTRNLEATRGVRDFPHIMTRVSDLARGQRGQGHVSNDERIPSDIPDYDKNSNENAERENESVDDYDKDIKIDPANFEKTLQKLRSKASLEKLRNRRQTRQDKVYAVEVVVAIDPSLWQKFYTDTQATGGMSREETTEYKLREHFSQIINGISTRYESIDSNELNIYVTVTAFLLYKTIDSTNPLPPSAIETFAGYEYQYVNSSVYLPALPVWLSNLSGLPDNDHVMVFTWYQVYSGNYWTGVAGITYLSGACTYRRVSLNEVMFTTFTTISVAAHELGHNLGADHDSGDCPAASSFIMSGLSQLQPGDAFTQNPWRFSTCSVNQFRKYIQYLDNSGQNCLLDKGDYYNADEFNTFISQLPDTADEQCKKIVGNHSGLGCGQTATDPSICQYMNCKTSTPGQCSAKTADQGTSCDDPALNKWCIAGACVPRSSISSAHEII
ncbi:hypothetical protein DPMN_161699 [Dreissena polymorpha]|uniref:Peptidase M12B domain-containing protein n=1 Tax=Dreissena polymorpha TaxID=45954 RepID=A0A9D4IRC1_DREPO|nr:hypothetical protein DPMN_161699 [Dreissena polymorpha]